MDRVQRLAERVKKLEEEIVKIKEGKYNDKPKLAGSIVFIGFVGLIAILYIAGAHWGWMVASFVFGASMALNISDSI